MAETAMFMFGIGIWFLFFLFFVLGVASLVFWIWTIVDACKRHFRDNSERALWVIIMLIFGVVGSIIYYFAVMRK